MRIVSGLAGCSSDAATAGDNPGSQAGGAPAGVKKVVVGTGTEFPNICFIDANGKLTGYV
ncbi:hypothetical protein [Brevibacillus sp. WF146]|uniref:hypothetical protein n=1 Tax=Brevibacillus sp. WF146 TaxID=319501 RepID=UPI0007ECCE0B